jgi:hypothetical protein
VLSHQSCPGCVAPKAAKAAGAFSPIYADGRKVDPIAIHELPEAAPVRTSNLLAVISPVPPYSAVTALPAQLPVNDVAPMLPAEALILINDVAPKEAVPLKTSLKTRNETPDPTPVVRFTLWDKPELVEDTANPALVEEMAKPALVEDTAKPALVEEIAKPALVDDTANPALVEDTAKPAFVDDTANPALVEEIAKPALVEDVALPLKVVAEIVLPVALTPDNT